MHQPIIGYHLDEHSDWVELVQSPGEESDNEEDVDATGLDQKDIDLVMQQSNASRARVVKTLRETNGDIVDAIMKLTNS